MNKEKINTIAFIAVDVKGGNPSEEITRQKKLIRSCICDIDGDTTREVLSLYGGRVPAVDKVNKLLEAVENAHNAEGLTIIAAYPAIVSASFSEVLELSELLEEMGHRLIFADETITGPGPTDDYDCL